MKACSYCHKQDQDGATCPVAACPLRHRSEAAPPLCESGDPPVGSRHWRCEKELHKAREALEVLTSAAAVVVEEAFVEDGFPTEADAALREVIRERGRERAPAKPWSCGNGPEAYCMAVGDPCAMHPASSAQPASTPNACAACGATDQRLVEGVRCFDVYMCKARQTSSRSF